VGKGVDPHRKVGLMVRSSLESGLSSCERLPPRGRTDLSAVSPDRGAKTPRKCNPRSRARRAPTRTQGRHLHHVGGPFGDPYATEELTGVGLGTEVYVGIYLCAHNADVTETAVLQNGAADPTARDDFRPYRDYIGSFVEVLDVTTGLRRIVHQVEDSIQAPNWTPDGRR